MLLTFLHWPVAALTRRRHHSPLEPQGRARIAYRAVRLSSGLILVTLVGWMSLFGAVTSDLTHLTAQIDPILWAIQIVGLIVFVAAVLVAGWNSWHAFAGPTRWTGKAAAVASLLASMMVLYVAFVFGLIDMTVNY